MDNRILIEETSKPLILIVDDVPKNLQVLGNILRKENYEIGVATNGLEALERIHEIHPDLILLDVMMPELNGFDTIKRLKEDQDTVDIPVIFLTAKTDIDDIVTGFKLGAVDYVTKPFNGTELLARVKTHLDLKLTREALQASLAAKDKFFSIISHDLRNPLNTLVSFIQLMREDIASLSKEDIIELTNELKNNVENAGRLLENLLEWSRSQTGRITYNPQEVDLQVIVHGVTTLVTETANKKDITIESNVGEDISMIVDMNMISTVIRNLVTNAIKFTKIGGKISIDSEIVADEIKISISDNGVGMNAEKCKKLFRIDTQVSTRGTSDERGTGLGLILCKEFVEKHHGRIEVESEPNVGSTFIVTLPMNK